MTRSQKIQVRQSEIREKLNGLLDTDTRTDEQQTELESLTGEIQKLEAGATGRAGGRTGREAGAGRHR